MITKSTQGLSSEQLANGTPADKKIILKAFYKDDKASISPAKDMNGRYKGIQENIPEFEKLKMGYVPDIESRVRIYDGIEIDLNDSEWAKDWEWMKYCKEIADDFDSGQNTPGAYFYIFRPGFEAAKKVSDTEKKVKLMSYILQDSPENLYNRVSILGMDMSSEAVSDVKEYLLNLVNTEPTKIERVYESKTFTLELLLLHAIKKGIVAKKNGVYVFGEILIGVDKNSVVSFFANPKNAGTTRAIESVTYGKHVEANPLSMESVSDAASDIDFDDQHVDEKVDDKAAAAIEKAKVLVAKDGEDKKDTKEGVKYPINKAKGNTKK